MVVIHPLAIPWENAVCEVCEVLKKKKNISNSRILQQLKSAPEQLLYGCEAALSTTVSKTKHGLNIYAKMDEKPLKKKACKVSITLW